MEYGNGFEWLDFFIRGEGTLKKFEWGERRKETIVFLHGLGSTGLSVGEMAAKLPEYHIVSFHLPGHGGTTPKTSEEEYYPSQLVDEIDTYIEQEAFYIAGHSWGAHLGCYYAAAYPEKVKGLILLDGGYLPIEKEGLDDELRMVESFYENIRFENEHEFLTAEKEELGRWSNDLQKASLAQVKEVDGKIRLAVSLFTAQSVIKGMVEEPVGKVLPNINCPVLLLRGTLPEDMEETRRSAAEQMGESVKHLDIIGVQEAGHDLYRDKPGRVSMEWKRWLQSSF
ncbi:alpha/beta fold hydrolase [Halobacillus litoralis]|uniref:Alpha/beta fold hydrolase n=1 Tax=Halobacillus litoralis TaxID=45668 RepID=A0A845F936_9BACI|nr:alpha/beta fold hydrolase [Halobacillus litoralis]